MEFIYRDRVNLLPRHFVTRLVRPFFKLIHLLSFSNFFILLARLLFISKVEHAIFTARPDRCVSSNVLCEQWMEECVPDPAMPLGIFLVET